MRTDLFKDASREPGHAGNISSSRGVVHEVGRRMLRNFELIAFKNPLRVFTLVEAL